jgi:2-polyprenyl-3-methyl-5-hydroxy-6-metoxy-1,4-benzoquinol methylase
MLLDYCERFNFIAATPRIYSILKHNDILVNNRLQAALLFLYPRPNTNSELVERFDTICEKLQLAIEIEEDNGKKAIATFLNYYGIIVNDTRLEFAEQVKEKLTFAIQNKNYPFLINDSIFEVLQQIDLQDDLAYTQIQYLIDTVFGKEETVITIPLIKTKSVKSDLLIETGTNYSKELMSVSSNFDAIRSISVRHADSCAITNRGVKILESEEELFEYMKRFGNMHKAKLQVAYDSLPETFSPKVNIIDWGCGQGIGSMLFLEKYGTDIVNNVTLIEPSEIAIKRAALHLKKYNPKISLKTICKKLDDLEFTDFINEEAVITFHLFSNILDIDDYSQSYLIKLIELTKSNSNYFVCASPYIDEIKTERLESFRRHFETKYDTFNLLLDVTNSKNTNEDFWCCNNTHNNHHISHGSYFNCNEYTENGCNNKWTRVIKVFKVNL